MHPATPYEMVPTTSGPPSAAPDADVGAVLLAAEQHGDERDDALGQRRPGGREDRADGDGPDLEADPEPFDRVDEPLAGEVDHDGAAGEQQDVDHGLSLQRRGDGAQPSTRGRA